MFVFVFVFVFGLRLGLGSGLVLGFAASVPLRSITSFSSSVSAWPAPAAKSAGAASSSWLG